MIRRYVNKLLITFLIILASVNTLCASKIKSSKSYLKNLQTTIKPLNSRFDNLKQLLNSIYEKDSLLTTDFWGLKPAWYVKGDYVEELSTAYPFTNTWIKGYGIWRNYHDNLIRNINGVILKPISENHRMNPSSWREEISLEIDFSPGYNNFDYYKKYIKKNLQSNGVPTNKLDTALRYFSSKANLAIEIVSDEIYSRFDTLYSGVAKMGYIQGYEYIAKKLDKKSKLNADDYLNPYRHDKLFTEELFQQYKSSLEVKSRKKLYKNYHQRKKELSLFDYYKNNYKLSIEVPIQHFVVAKGMSKSQQYNQLKKLKEMLDKKVSENKAIVKEGKITIYESVGKDSKSRIGIDFKTGQGYWQLPFWDYKQQVKSYFKEIENDVKKVNTVLEKYLSLVLKETIKEFRATNAQTSDF